MVSAAIRSNPAFKTLDIELKRGGVSYTIYTLRELKQLYPELEFYFIIGADMVNYLPKWEGIEELTTMLHFIGLQRPGSFLELDLLPPFIQDVVLLAEMPLVDISSSLIRKQRAAGHSVRYMVTEEVHEYITRSGLYAVHS